MGILKVSISEIKELDIEDRPLTIEFEEEVVKPVTWTNVSIKFIRNEIAKLEASKAHTQKLINGWIEKLEAVSADRDIPYTVPDVPEKIEITNDTILK
jgi:hypothetical protein